MNRMISLARIMFAGLGIYLSITICGNILQPFLYMINGVELDDFGTLSVSLLIAIGLLAAVVWFLFIKGDYLARKLIVKDVDADKPLGIDLTLAMAFRLVCTGAGLLCLRTLIFQVGRIASLIRMSNHFPDGFGPLGRIQLSEYIQMVLLIALTAYLMCGAPHFVRWQVKKTLKLCG